MSEEKENSGDVSNGLLTTTNDVEKLEGDKIKLYKRRWLVLLIFILYAAVNAAEWAQYAIMPNFVTRYYKVSDLSVYWTAMIYMALYSPLVIPSSYIIDTMGLRVAALIGCLGTAIGTFIKIFATSQDQFWIVFLGQVLLSIAAVPILSLPPRIAAVWFGAKEVSTACSLGVFGTQLGMAIGFVLPPIFVKDRENIEDLGHDFYLMHWAYTGMMIPLAIAVLFYPAQPPLPPSFTQVQERNSNVKPGSNFFTSIKILLTNKAFLLHFVAYGINIAVFSAVGTLLGKFISVYFENSEEDAGRMGLAMVVVGMLGSIAFGVFLDMTHKYKETTLGIYLMSSLSVVLFMYALESQSKLFVYIAISVVGLFTNAYMPVGFELAIELTYPSPESTTSGILMAMTQFLGVLFAVLLGELFEMWGTFWALSSQALLLLIGTVITFLVPNDLRRQAAFNASTESRKKIKFSPVAVNDLQINA